jgi:hypothetical protein
MLITLNCLRRKTMVNQEKLIPASPPPVPNLFCVMPALQTTPKKIEKATIDEFLYLSRQYLGLDKNS